MDAKNNTEYLLYASVVSPRYYLEFGPRGKSIAHFYCCFQIYPSWISVLDGVDLGLAGGAVCHTDASI